MNTAVETQLPVFIKEISSWNRICIDTAYFEAEGVNPPTKSFLHKNRWMLSDQNTIVCTEKPSGYSCFDAHYDLGLIFDRMTSRFDEFSSSVRPYTPTKLSLFHKQITILRTHIKSRVKRYQEQIDCTRYIVRAAKSLFTHQGEIEARSQELLNSIQEIQKKFPVEKKERAPIREELLWHYPEAGDELFQLMLKTIEGAKKKIFLLMYSLSNAALMGVLEEKQRQGVKVRLFVDKDAFKDARQTLGKEIRVVTVDSKGLMHLKICVIDSIRVLFGSCNLTTQSMKIDQNLMTEISSKPLAKHVKTYAKYLALEEKDQKKYSDISILLSDKEKLQFSFVQQQLSEKMKIIGLLNGAKKTIAIAMFTFTDKSLLAACIAAKDRGVDVQVILDGNQARHKNTGLMTVERLRKQDITVQTSKAPSRKLMHHKICLIDKNTFIYGSTNWTKKAFDANEECLAIIQGLSPKNYRIVSKIWQSLLSTSSN